MEYKILTRKAFEKMSSFEKRINDMSLKGWRVVASLSQGATPSLVMGRQKY